jgi:hypothetical protein
MAIPGKSATGKFTTQLRDGVHISRLPSTGKT